MKKVFAETEKVYNSPGCIIQFNERGHSMTWNKRTLMILIPVCILFLLLTAFLSYRTLDRLMMERSMDDNNNVLKQIESQIMNVFEETELFSKMICIDETINNKLTSGQNLSIYEQDKLHYDIMLHFKPYSNLCRYVDTFVIQRNNGEIYTSVRGFEKDYEKELEEDWFLRFKEQGLNGTFSEKHPFFTPMGTRYVDGVSYILRYNLPGAQNGEYCFLVAEINWSVFDDILSEYKSDYAQVALLARNYQPLSGKVPDQQITLPSGVDTYQETHNYYYRTVDLGRTGWHLLLILNKSTLASRSVSKTFGYLLIIVPLFIILTTVLMSLVRRTGRSLNKLKNAMQSISEGKLDTRVSLHTHDEFETLGNSVNEMAVSLQAYMDAQARAEEDKQKIRTNLLLAQIRPHFIYNTLNSVIYLTEEKRYDDAISSIRSLITLLQDMVGFSKCETNTLMGEIDILKHYLNIQGIRYPDSFNLIVDIPEELRNCIVPKILLQPVVENALIHGIVPSGRCCDLEINARKLNEEWLLLYVKDNGVGMTKERIRDVLNRQGNFGMRGIGLSNIRERMRLLYGTDYDGLRIISEPGQGTKIEMMVKLEYGSDKDGTIADSLA